MNTTSSTKSVGTLKIGMNITATMAHVSLILISVATTVTATEVKKLNAQIESEGKRMEKFGLDTKKLQSLVDYFTPGKTSSLSKDDARKIAYQFLVYQKVKNGVNVLEPLGTLVPSQIKTIFGTSVTLSLSAAIDQLKKQSILMNNVSAKETFSPILQEFAKNMNSQISKTTNQYPVASVDLGLKTVTFDGVKEFAENFFNDCSNWVRNQVSDATIEQKTTIASAIGCTTQNVEKWAVEYRKPANEFNSSNHPAIEEVQKALDRKGITGYCILSLHNTSKELIADLKMQKNNNN